MMENISMKKTKKVCYSLYLQYDETRSGGEPLSDDQWCSHTDEIVTFTPLSLRLSETKGLYQETIEVKDFKPKLDEKLYLVVARYITGGSFGMSRGRWELIGLMRKEDEALMARNCISELNHIQNPRCTGKLISFYSNGSQIYPCWDGYFERLEEVEIHKLTVES